MYSWFKPEAYRTTKTRLNWQAKSVQNFDDLSLPRVNESRLADYSDTPVQSEA